MVKVIKKKPGFLLDMLPVKKKLKNIKQNDVPHGSREKMLRLKFITKKSEL